ncbi:hypothetical protein D3C78_1808820 [compost metagenome]
MTTTVRGPTFSVRATRADSTLFKGTTRWLPDSLTEKFLPSRRNVPKPPSCKGNWPISVPNKAAVSTL